MPSDASGNYSLPAGYLAVTGETVQASQHNPPLEDLASSMTARVMTTGATPLTGPLKLSNGSAAAPAMTFSSATNVGFFRTADGIGVAVNGTQVFEFTAVSSGVPVGAMVDWGSTTAPTGWLHCNGASLLRASYPALFAAIGGNFGSVDSTHFTLPNLRGTVAAGWDEGLAGGRLAGADNIGALLGAQTVTLDVTHLPAHTHGGTTGDDTPDHTHSVPDAVSKVGTFTGGGSNGWAGAGSATSGGASARHRHPFTTDSGTGGLQPHPNVQPTLILPKIIFAGA